MTAPLTPIDIAPANGSTVTTSNFMASATLRPWPLRQKLQFQFASDSAFTTNARIVETDWKNPGALTVLAGLPRLPSGACYYRARAVEEGTSDASAWSSTYQLTITHPGSALLVSPGYGASMPWASGSVTFDWEFSDTSQYDTQTAYRLLVQTNNADSTYANLKLVYATYSGLRAVNDNYTDTSNSGGTATVYDSGKVTSANTAATVTLAAGARNELVRWSVQTWDNDDTSAGATNYFPLFVGDLPVVTITAPGSTTDTPNPVVTWTYTSAAGHAQERYRVRVQNASTGALLFDSGTQTGSTTRNYYLPSAILTNGVAVNFIVDVISSIGMQQSATKLVTPSWKAPPNPSFEVVANNFNTFGRVDLDWTGAPKDSTFVEWKVYRRTDSFADWEYVGSTTDYTYYDHGAPPLSTVQYSVTQVGVAYGVLVESQLFPIGVDLTSTVYMLKSQVDPGRVLMLENVTSDDFSDEFEMEVMNIIGVGRKTEVGTNWGKKGSLNVQFRDFGVDGRAADDYSRLVDIKEAGDACWLRIPFRDTLLVSIGDIQTKRIAGVANELVDVTIEYTEISL